MMYYTAEQIHEKLITEYPQHAGCVRSANIGRNCRPLAVRTEYLYILDTSPSDPYQSGINHYRNNLASELQNKRLAFVECLPFPFKGHENQEAIAVLHELTNLLGVVNFDIEDSFKRLKITINDSEQTFFIVITVVAYDFLEIDS